jgi:hypothetical protein
MSVCGLIDALLDVRPEGFRVSEEVHPELERRARQRFGPSSARVIGRSEEGRPIHGFTLGEGSINVTLVAGNHADEPVGPETLRSLVYLLSGDEDAAAALRRRFRFFIVPHTNPDGEARNRRWTQLWPDLKAFLSEAERDAPGRDLEFGYPGLRPENSVVASFMRQAAPVSLHMSLHGMAFARGTLLLIDRTHAPHASTIRRTYASAAQSSGIGLHDENRLGDKGFFYLAPGFWTTPEGEAMRRHFTVTGQPEVARQFRQSSMEFVETLGGLPLSLVTEVPLFRLGEGADDETMAMARMARRRIAEGAPDAHVMIGRLSELTTPVSLRDAIYLQATALDAGLTYVQRKK